MHCIELARIATLIAAQGPSLATLHSSIPTEAITRYWVASRQRTELWNRGLARLVDLETAGQSLAIDAWWFEHVPMIEEILVSEMLTRVMACVGAVLDDEVEDRDVEPVTHSVFQTHLESRNRVLRVLLFSRGRSVEQALRLNRLRRCVERWTDFLIAPLVRVRPASIQFAIDPGRAQAYASELTADYRDRGSDGVNWLSAATLELSLGGLCDRRAALPQANQQVGQSVLACLRPQVFDSLGVPHTATTGRILAGHSPECPPACENTAGNRGDKHVLFHAPQTRPAAPNLVRWTF
jgi:hypothetical protein